MAAPRSGNILLIARREFLVRGRTRAFKVGTLLVILASLAVALLPVVIRLVSGESSGDKVGIVARADLGFDAVARFDAVLDMPSTLGPGKAFDFSEVGTEADARAGVRRGDLTAAIVLSRGASGDLWFTVISKQTASARSSVLLSQGAAQVSIEDRLARDGLSPAQQAALFAPPVVSFVRPDDTTPNDQSLANEIATAASSQILVIFIFIAIVMYGQWVATSVAEEKSSRVIEIVINAATPTELLIGKVVGVGGLGLIQYVAAVVPAVLGFAFQDRIMALVFGSAAGAGAGAGSAGLTPGVLVLFGLFFVLGFVLYATLYAAAGSLVSRMEDVNSVVGPMMFLGMAGYLVAVYTASGLIPPDAPWLVVFSYVPFASPFLMLTRASMGAAGAGEVALAIAILLVSIVAALWVAAHVYTAGVLMYGQKAGFRTFLRTAFGRQP